MSRLNDLLQQLEATHPSLAKELRVEYDALADRKQFGLNFERHTPESVELPGRAVRRGDKVHVLPERGKNPTAENSRLWRVVAIDKATRVATLEDSSKDPVETIEQPLDELVVVAEFRDPIYPGLVSTGRIEKGGGKPFHAVINAENYHALQTLLYTHRGQVDLIYIDPPYNTGTDDWIYNDKYVAGDDHYKHSKWLAFMERRLLLAKELLKPTGAIAISIGHDESHRLRMLCDEIFGADNFLSTISRRSGSGGRQNTYIKQTLDFIHVYRSSLETPGFSVAKDASYLANFKNEDSSGRYRTEPLYKATLQSKGRKMRYWIEAPDGTLVIPPGETFPEADPNADAVISVGENDKIWRWSPETFAAKRDLIVFKKTKTSPLVTPTGNRAEWNVYTKQYLDDESGSAPLDYWGDNPNTLGTKHLLSMGIRFPYPKPVELIQKLIEMSSPKDGIIVDFFGGSGTTSEATIRLNAIDGGSRKSIVISNNELGKAQMKDLRKAGHRPGDPEWEAKGVYAYVTKPRISTVVSGFREDGSVYSEGLAENVEFFTLTYEAPLRVSTNREFAKVAPLLWMKAGAKGRRIDDLSAGFDVADSYGVIEDIDQTSAFIDALTARIADGAEIGMVFVITNDDRLFTAVCRELPAGVEAVRLYDSYLRNFEIESGRNA